MPRWKREGDEDEAEKKWEELSMLLLLNRGQWTII